MEAKTGRPQKRMPQRKAKKTPSHLTNAEVKPTIPLKATEANSRPREYQLLEHANTLQDTRTKQKLPACHTLKGSVQRRTSVKSSGECGGRWQKRERSQKECAGILNGEAQPPLGQQKTGSVPSVGDVETTIESDTWAIGSQVPGPTHHPNSQSSPNGDFNFKREDAGTKKGSDQKQQLKSKHKHKHMHRSKQKARRTSKIPLIGT